MTDNFDELPNDATCYILNSATSIYAYRNNVRSSYTQVGGKWYKSAESVYTNIPNNAYCISYSSITKLNSNAVFEPFLIGLSFCLAVFVWWAVFSIFSRLVRWKA